MKKILLSALALFALACSSKPATPDQQPVVSNDVVTGPTRFIASVGSVFRCYSKSYTAREATLVIAGTVVDDQKVRELEMKDDVIGLDYRLPAAVPASAEKRAVPGYVSYAVGANPNPRAGAQPLEVLLPEKMTAVSGRFDAYVSNAEADGYVKVGCRK